MNLENLNVQEMNKYEMKETNGGGLFLSALLFGLLVAGFVALARSGNCDC